MADHRLIQEVEQLLKPPIRDQNQSDLPRVQKQHLHRQSHLANGYSEEPLNSMRAMPAHLLVPKESHQDS